MLGRPSCCRKGAAGVQVGAGGGGGGGIRWRWYRIEARRDQGLREHHQSWDGQADPTHDGRLKVSLRRVKVTL